MLRPAPVDKEGQFDDCSSSYVNDPKEVDANSAEGHYQAGTGNEGVMRRLAGDSAFVELLDPCTAVGNTQVSVVDNLRGNKHVIVSFSHYFGSKFHTSSVESRLSRMLGMVEVTRLIAVDVALDVALGVNLPAISMELGTTRNET